MNLSLPSPAASLAAGVFSSTMTSRPFPISRTHFRAAFACIVMLAGALTCGCQAKPPTAPSASIAGLSASVGRADARVDALLMVGKTALPESVRAYIAELAGRIKADFVALNAQIEESRRDEKLMEGSIANLERDKAVQAAEIKRLNDAYVGPATWRKLHLIVAAYFAAGILSVVLGVLSPFGWGMTVSKLINTLGPLGTPWVLIRDLLLSRARGLQPAVVASR